MRGARRVAVDVGTGTAAVLAVAAARSITRRRRPPRGVAGRRRARRSRKLARERAVTDARWVRENTDATSALLDASAHASALVADRDNARRGARAYVEMCALVQDNMNRETRSRADAKRLDAWQHKVRELEAERRTYRLRFDAAEAQLADAQVELRLRLVELQPGAPAEVVTVATELVAAHGAARHGDPDQLAEMDEALAERRLERLITLRDELDQTLGRLAGPGAQVRPVRTTATRGRGLWR